MMQDTDTKPNVYTCPICGYPNLDTPPYGDVGEPSYEICPSCGTEFGVEDHELTQEELRQRWLSTGPKWHSRVIAPPPNWNGEEQVRSLLS